MEWYFILFIVLCVCVFFLLFPLFFQIRFYVNILENLGSVGIYFLFIKVKEFRVKLSTTALKIINKNEQEKEIKLVSPNSIFMLKFLKNLFYKTKIFELSLFSNFGKKDDAFFVAIANGFLINFVHYFFQIIHNTKGDFVSHFVCDKDFENNDFSFSGYFSVLTMPILIFICLIKAFFELLKKKRKFERS